jgi:hypothetical protein
LTAARFWWIRTPFVKGLGAEEKIRTFGYSPEVDDYLIFALIAT